MKLDDWCCETINLNKFIGSVDFIRRTLKYQRTQDETLCTNRHVIDGPKCMGWARITERAKLGLASK
jgi:hypothetical protein